MHDSTIPGVTMALSALRPLQTIGRVVAVDGALVWVTGISDEAAIGDRARLTNRDRSQQMGDVLRIRDGLVAVLPDEGTTGVALNDRVCVVGPVTLAPTDTWIGRVIDPYGQPLDDMPCVSGAVPRKLAAPPPSAAARRGLGPTIHTGLFAFDCLLPIAKGQRIGLFAGSGVGKSHLLARLAQGMEADVVVLSLVGERGRELRDFVANVLGPEGMARTVVVAATSDRSAVERRRCPMSAMTIAEHFRDQGKHVLYLADSLTRFAEAHREAATAAGEIPALRGFPASTANHIMALCERAGPGVEGAGDITAVFSVLVAGSDMEEPIADIVRGVLDGHIVLNRAIAERGRYPAIDLSQSVSRCLPAALSDDENALILRARRLIGAYERSETLIRSGLYRSGSDHELDQAIAFWPDIDAAIGSDAPGTQRDTFAKLQLLLKRADRGIAPKPRIAEAS
ncbi:FliI/YscN family ATPase [Pseudoprimorskyibacter insulae]|uniref:Flagellum-specific ATP synthase n=1 Tax=Pseudoprimorskyibacter insulae TaxID=1695997 RepID=A0A2R8AYX9_9RHOB|nr:FliI/YscN family ATPase [Pseudoprimorskyibacter insulae]SPF81210.1 Flagellum-specific ATP synthase [Pseudoprimorskyibacter insulae]